MDLAIRATWVRTASLLTVVWIALPAPAPASDDPPRVGFVTVNAVPPPLDFFSLAPCRVVDSLALFDNFRWVPLP